MLLDPAQHRLRLQRHARALHAVHGRGLHDQIGDGGMQMEMLVGVDVIQRQAGGGEGGELGVDLGGELAAHFGQEEHRRACPRHVGAEIAAGVHQVGNGRAGSTGLPSTSTRCRPTRRLEDCAPAPPHRRRPAPDTIRLAADENAVLACARSTASLTSRRRAEVIRRDDQGVSR